MSIPTRFLALLLLAAMCLSFSGCGKEENISDMSDMKEAITVEDSGNAEYISMDGVTNASLIPDILPDEQVVLEKSGDVYTPDWFKSLIIVELRIETATEEGTFEAAIPLLDYYADLGVNCIWLTPIYEKGAGGNGYGNQGPHTVEPKLTGTDDRDEGWQAVKRFVDEAHKRNIRILLDIVTWGVMRGADLITEHPDFFNGEAWGNIAFDWTNQNLKDWFIDVAVNNILVTGADGYRCDCEPNFSGYEVFAEVKSRLLEKGRKIAVISEDGNSRENVYDCEQDGVLPYSLISRGGQYVDPISFYLGNLNIVDSVKTGTGIGSESLQADNAGGTFRYYTFCVTNHDYQKRYVNANRLKIGYQAIFAPYIPIWYQGDECGVKMAYNAVLYDVPTDFTCIKKEANKAFFDDVKRMIQIRRTYTDIFEYFPDNHRDSNICKVNTTGLTELQAYARFSDDRAVLIIPNNEAGNTGEFTAEIPYIEMGFGKGQYRITNLLTGEVLSEGAGREVRYIKGQVKYRHMAVYLIEKI